MADCDAAFATADSRGFFVGCVDGEEGVAVAEDGADGPLESVFCFRGDVGGYQVHSLALTAFLCFALEVRVVAADDLADDAVGRGRAVDGRHGQAEFLRRQHFGVGFVV